MTGAELENSWGWFLVKFLEYAHLLRMDKVGKDFVLGIVLDILTVKLEVFRGEL